MDKKYLFIIVFAFKTEDEDGFYECRLYSNNDELTVSQYKGAKELVQTQFSATEVILISTVRYLLFFLSVGGNTLSFICDPPNSL